MQKTARKGERGGTAWEEREKVQNSTKKLELQGMAPSFKASVGSRVEWGVQYKNSLCLLKAVDAAFRCFQRRGGLPIKQPCVQSGSLVSNAL